MQEMTREVGVEVKGKRYRRIMGRGVFLNEQYSRYDLIVPPFCCTEDGTTVSFPHS